MALGDIYQINVFQQYLGQEMLNVFHYRSTEGSSNAADLVSAFADDVWDLVRLFQTGSVVTNRYYCINGMDNGDFQDQSAADAGSGAFGNNMPPNICAAFRSPSGGPGTRYSYKRIGGLGAGVYSGSGNGKIGAAPLDGVLADIAAAFGVHLEGTSGGYAPVLITGGFVLGVEPVFSRNLLGQWTINPWTANQRTRQNYEWEYHAP